VTSLPSHHRRFSVLCRRTIVVGSFLTPSLAPYCILWQVFVYPKLLGSEHVFAQPFTSRAAGPIPWMSESLAREEG
jgi:hypothetical protein